MTPLIAKYSKFTRQHTPVKESQKTPSVLIALSRELQSRSFQSFLDGNRLVVDLPISLTALDKFTWNLRHWTDSIDLFSISTSDTFPEIQIVLVEK